MPLLKGRASKILPDFGGLLHCIYSVLSSRSDYSPAKFILLSQEELLFSQLPPPMDFAAEFFSLLLKGVFSGVSQHCP